MPEPTPAGVVTLLATAPDAATAERLARTLVEERLAACANLLPGAISIYRWEGEIQRDEEVIMFIKTTRTGLDSLRTRFIELHPYDVPELLAVPVVGGSSPYLRWVGDQVGEGG